MRNDNALGFVVSAPVSTNAVPQVFSQVAVSSLASREEQGKNSSLQAKEFFSHVESPAFLGKSIARFASRDGKKWTGDSAREFLPCKMSIADTWNSSRSSVGSMNGRAYGAESGVEEDVEIFEYMSAANPKIPTVPFGSLPARLHEEGPTRVIPYDLSDSLQTPYPATTPNLLANYMRIRARESLKTAPNASSQFYFVIRGSGRTESLMGNFDWNEGDVFVLPASLPAEHFGLSDAALYYVTDEPLLAYLGVKPVETRFRPTLYTRARLLHEMEQVRSHPGAASRNRMGILLGNAATPLTKTITHTLWSLYNVITPNLVQRPHRHNSVALDLCVSAKPGVYTLISNKLDANGNLVRPIRQDWVPGEVFVTPPGLWHSHHNESGTDAYVLPVQDAGLHTYLRTLDIQFT